MRTCVQRQRSLRGKRQFLEVPLYPFTVTHTMLMSVNTRCPKQQQTNCQHCHLGDICLPLALEKHDVNRLDEIIKRSSPLRKGDYVYQTNDPFSSVFAVKQGHIKTFRLTEDGEEQITGFYYPGEVFGIDGISGKRYACSAQALESASICAIPFAQFQQLTLDRPSLQSHFFHLMSHRIASDQKLITLLNKKTARERIATFLIATMERRQALEHGNPTGFRLPMSRTDIGNYLGLTIETVSRTFNYLNKAGLIALEQKNVSILDINGLRQTANLD